MPQQEKITKKLDLDKRAQVTGVRIVAKTANYTVDKLLDSGSYIIADNSSQAIFFTLPPVNACNGQYWNFFTANAGIMQICGDALNVNNIVDDYGVSQYAINFGLKAEGHGCRMICSGTKYYVVGCNPFASSTQVNVSYQQG